jgi:endonuclease/exonuclease/phosphatase family metal-dependent hydrolase
VRLYHSMEESSAKRTIPFRVVTLNVRYARKEPVPGEQPWQVRCPKLCAQLSFITVGHASAFVCLQEVLYSQLKDIQSHLGGSWAHIGHGRNDGKHGGEFSPIFYPTQTWRCERNKTYWLSETPQKPSKGWDAALNRVVTIGEFHHKESGVRVVVMSTHLDHQGMLARKESAKLLLELANQWSRGDESRNSTPVILGGDFNSTPGDPAYKEITASGLGMVDARDLVPKDMRYGNEMTYTSFGEPDEKPVEIDFLFVRDPRLLKILTFGVLSNRFDDKVYLSDHRPVVVDMEILV